jgi:hypothetical protein
MASVALGVKLWALWRTAPEPAKPVRFQLAPENVTITSSFRFALSPDGTKLAYQASGSDGVIRLWVRFLDSLEARPLPATDVVANVPFFWSYDSRFVVFASPGSLKKIETAGGPPQTLCAVTGIPVGGSWNREGVIIFGHGTAGPLMQVPSEGGTATPVTVIDPARNELYHQSPVFLPDGRHFLYLRRGGSESTGIYVGSLDEKPDHQPSKRLLAAEYGVEFAPHSGWKFRPDHFPARRYTVCPIFRPPAPGAIRRVNPSSRPRVELSVCWSVFSIPDRLGLTHGQR